MQDCYECIKTRQWFFFALGGYFNYEFWKTYPYATRKLFWVNLAPVLMFFSASVFSRWKANEILEMRKLVSDEEIGLDGEMIKNESS